MYRLYAPDIVGQPGKSFQIRPSPQEDGHVPWTVDVLDALDLVTQRGLSRQVAIEDATMVRTLDRMKRDGLVRRERDPHDRRRIKVFLMEKGWGLRDTLVPQAIAGNRLATQQLSEDEQRRLLSLLRRVIGALEGAQAAEKGRSLRWPSRRARTSGRVTFSASSTSREGCSWWLTSTPLGNHNAFETLVRFVFVPVLIGTGMAMWLLPRLRKRLRDRSRPRKGA
jgi:DNA-binding MarR family transcriptional regulator